MKDTLLIITGILSSSVLTAWATGYFSKPKTSAEARKLDAEADSIVGNSWKEFAYEIQKELRALREEFGVLQNNYNILENKYDILKDQYDSLKDAYEHTKKELETYQSKPKETTTTISQVTN